MQTWKEQEKHTHTQTNQKRLSTVLVSYFVIFYTLYCPFREIWVTLPGFYNRKSSVTQSDKCMLGLLCVHNPPNSDMVMDYRISNLRTWSFLCVRIHTRVGHTDNESVQHFDSEKLSEFFLMLLTGFEPEVHGSWVWHSTNWATPPPLYNSVAVSISW